MGVKQSKRSVDITEISTKGEIEGFGNEGKVEKIVEGVAEKVAANGHVDGDLLNGGEPQQNGIEPVQNGEAAAVACEKVEEMKADDEPATGVVNGTVENGDVNGEAEKIDEEPKKEKKKEKKEKVKKRFSLRNFSFSKKDKTKPKEDRSPEKVMEAQNEEAPNSPAHEQNEAQEQSVEVLKPEVAPSQMNSTAEVEIRPIAEEPKQETEQNFVEKVTEGISKTVITSEDLPPPLPASPPPNESAVTEQESSIVTVETNTIKEVAHTVTNILIEKVETTDEVIKSAEQIAIETGKQIEEKATNLLKTVEERAGESLKTVQEFFSQKTEESVETCQNKMEAEQVVTECLQKESEKINEAAETVAENLVTAPVEISNVDSLATNPEDSLEKREEGAGESLADIPQDMGDVTEVTVEAPETDSLEISAVPPPPPVVEPVTGE